MKPPGMYTRQLTGKPKVHRAYVLLGGAVVSHCSHNHRSLQAAERCAKKQLSAYAAAKEPTP